MNASDASDLGERADPAERSVAWIVVDEVTHVVDTTGKVIGRLRPGQRYQANEVTSRYVRLPGPNGASGFVQRHRARLESDGPVSPGNAATSRNARPSTERPDPPSDVGIDASSREGSRPTTPGTDERDTTADQPNHPPTPPSVPAGWMPDPEIPAVFIRYWDGSDWTEHRAPAPPGGIAGSVASNQPAATPGSGRPNIARVAGGVVVLWAIASVVRVAYDANLWGDGFGFGYADEASPWWAASAPWAMFFGSLVDDAASWYTPGGRVLFSPLWIITALIGLIGLALLVWPKRGLCHLMIWLMVLNIAGTSALGINPEFLGDTLRVVITAAVIPVVVIVSMVLSLRRPRQVAGESESSQRDQMVDVPVPG